VKIFAAIDRSNFSNCVTKELSSRRWPDESTIKLVTIMSAGETEPSNSFLDTQQHLTDLAQQLSEIQPSCQFLPEIHYGHDVAEELLKLSAAWQADLLIIADCGKSLANRMLLGSVSEVLLERAQIPVTVAKEGHSNNPENSVNVLVPLDNSPFSIKAIEWLVRQQWTKPINIKLMTVLPSLSDLYASEPDTEKAEKMLRDHQKIKDEALAFLRQWEPQIDRSINPVKGELQICEGSPSDEILQEAEKWPAELILMGSHGHTGFKRHVIGSVAKAVSQKARCSVEVVRWPDLEEHYRDWKRTADDTYLEDLRQEGRYDVPHIMGATW